MKLWMSGEIQADVESAYRHSANTIEAEVNRLLDGVTFEDKPAEWAFIAIIRREDHPDHDEVVKKSSRGKSLEFRLKVPHADFSSASQDQQIGLIFGALARSVNLMAKLGISANTRTILQGILSHAEKNVLGGQLVQ